MTGNYIIIECHPMGFHVHTVEDDGPTGLDAIIDDEEEARDCVAIMAGCTGWPIDDRTLPITVHG